MIKKNCKRCYKEFVPDHPSIKTCYECKALLSIYRIAFVERQRVKVLRAIKNRDPSLKDGEEDESVRL